MPGLTQQDVTPTRVEPEEEKEDQGYQWMRWLTKPGNELKHLGNRAVETVQRLNSNVDRRGRVGLLKLYSYKEPDPLQERLGTPQGGSDGILRPGLVPAQREVPAGVVEATIDPALQATSLIQQTGEEITARAQGREPVQTDVGDTAVGRMLLQAKEENSDFWGVPQRYELDPRDRWIRDFSSSATSAIYSYALLRTAGLTPGANPYAFTGTKLNPMAATSQFGNAQRVMTQVRGPWGAYWRQPFNQKWGTSLARWLTFGGLESFTTTAISNQTEAGYAKPDDSLATGAARSLVGNAGEDLAVGGLLVGAGKLAEVGVKGTFRGLDRLFQDWLNSPSSVARNQQAVATRNSVVEARKWTETKGFQQETPDGSYEFNAENPWTTESVTAEQVADQIDQTASRPPVQPPAATTPAEAVADLLGVQRGPASTAAPEPMALPEAWDPSIPEIDVVKRSLDELEDFNLAGAAEDIAAGKSTLDAIGERLNQQAEGMRQAAPMEMQLGPSRVMSPDEAITASAMFMTMDMPQLRAMANSNALVQGALAQVNRTPGNASRQELIAAVLGVQSRGGATPMPGKVPDSAMSPEVRDQLQARIVGRALETGEVRPTTTPIPEIPEPSTKDVSDMSSAELVAEEMRLRGEYQKRDNRKAEAEKNAQREESGYYEKPEAEQVAAGKYDGWDKPADPTAEEAVARGQAAPAPTGQEFVIPKDLSKSAPRYSDFQLRFESDLDRAAYMIRNKAKKSKGEDRMIAALEEQGFDVDEIRALGEDIKEQIKQAAKGYKEVNGQPKVLEIPASTRDLDGLDNVAEVGSEPQLPDFSDMDPESIRQLFEESVDRRYQEMQAEMALIAAKVFGDDLPTLKFNREKSVGTMRKEWGGDGKKKSEKLGVYYPMDDLVVINNMTGRTKSSLRSTMHHEAWHRIQAGYLTPKQLKVMDNAFGKQDIEFFSRLRFSGKVQPIEIQARAFENYSLMRDAGRTRRDVLRAEMIDYLDSEFKLPRGSWKNRITAEAFSVIDEAWFRIYNFAQRANNLIEGNGFTAVYDLFEQAYDGRLAANKKFEGFYQTLSELEDMTDLQFTELAESDRWPAFDEKVKAAVDRKFYWNKWKGRSAKAVSAIDNQIAALKQQAINGGC